MSTVVFVYLYDLSKGLSNQFSSHLFGKHIEGIWHSGIVVFGKEIFYGSNGIDFTQPEGTILGPPDKKVFIGSTSKTEDELFQYISLLSSNRFHGSKYELLYHNCNSFSNELSLWLTCKGIPDYVVNLPIDILSSPLGRLIQPYLETHSSVAPVDRANTSSLKNNVNPDLKMSPIRFQEPIHLYSDQYHKELQALLNCNLYKSLMYLIDPSVTEALSLSSDDIFDLIRICSNENSIDVQAKLIVFDVLRLRALDKESIRLEFCDAFQKNSQVLFQDSDDIALEQMKCKLICNVVGALPNNKDDKTILLIVKNYALQILNRLPKDFVSSSLIRNVVINKSKLDFESCIEIASSLIHLVCEDNTFTSTSIEENVMGSIYYLVKEYQEIKDLAISYGISVKLTAGTLYCLALLNELKTN